MATTVQDVQAAAKVYCNAVRDRISAEQAYESALAVMRTKRLDEEVALIAFKVAAEGLASNLP